jgi:hypothetical protein
MWNGAFFKCNNSITKSSYWQELRGVTGKRSAEDCQCLNLQIGRTVSPPRSFRTAPATSRPLEKSLLRLFSNPRCHLLTNLLRIPPGSLMPSSAPPSSTVVRCGRLLCPMMLPSYLPNSPALHSRQPSFKLLVILSWHVNIVFLLLLDTWRWSCEISLHLAQIPIELIFRTIWRSKPRVWNLSWTSFKEPLKMGNLQRIHWSLDWKGRL